MSVSGSGLTRGEWIAVSGGVVLAVALVALPFFAITVDGFVQPGRDGAAFELLDGLDIVLLQAALIPLVVPAVRAGPLGARIGEGAASRVVAVAGLVAVLVTLYVMAAPPEPDVLISGALESSADVGLAPRAGAFIGLAGSVAILAGGAIDMAATAAAIREDVQQRQAPEATQPPAPSTAVLAAPLATTAPTKRSAAAKKPSAARKPAASKKPPATKKPAASRKPSTAKKIARPAARKTTRKTTQKASTRKPAATKPRKAVAKLSFAAATESQLRGLGLSKTQARRVVRYRDELGLASRVTELEVIPGLPKATLRELKSKLRD